MPEQVYRSKISGLPNLAAGSAIRWESRIWLNTGPDAKRILVPPIIGVYSLCNSRQAQSFLNPRYPHNPLISDNDYLS